MMKRLRGVFILIGLLLLGLRVSAQSFIWIPIQINVTDGHNSKVLTIGYDTLATAGRDGYDLIDTTTVAQGSFDAYLINGDIKYNRDIRKLDGETKIFTIKYAAEDGYGPVKLSWDPKTFPEEGTFELVDTVDGDAVTTDMREHTMYDTSVSTSDSNEVLIRSTVPPTTGLYFPVAMDTIPDFTIYTGRVSPIYDYSRFFTDKDYNDNIIIAFQTSDSSIAVPVKVGNWFYVQAKSEGTATLAVTGTDESGAQASIPFNVTVKTPDDTSGWLERIDFNDLKNHVPLFFGEYPDATDGFDSLLDQEAVLTSSNPWNYHIFGTDGKGYVEDFRSMDNKPKSFTIDYQFNTNDWYYGGSSISWNRFALPDGYSFIITDTSANSRYSSVYEQNMRTTDRIYISNYLWNKLRSGFKIWVSVPVRNNHAPVLTKPIPDQQIMQYHEGISIDLDNYFSDPDGDTLSYLASFRDNPILNFNINNTDLKIQPMESTGTENISIEALDDYGGKATTNIKVTVTKDTSGAIVHDMAWNFHLVVSDSIHSDTLVVGLSDSASSGFDQGIDEMASALPKDTTAFYARIFSTTDTSYTTDYRNKDCFHCVWHIQFHPSAGHHITLSWNPPIIVDTELYLQSPERSFYLNLSTTDHYYVTDASLTQLDLDYWAVKYIDPVQKQSDSEPQKTRLKQNYPNPFNPTTNIEYTLSKPVHVQLRVYNMLGQLVATLVDQKQTAGNHHLTFNADRFASGVYIYQLRAGNLIQTKKMIIIK